MIDDTSVYPVEEDFNFFSSNRLQRVVSSLRFVLTSFEPDFDIKKTTLFKILPDRDSSRILQGREDEKFFFIFIRRHITFIRVKMKSNLRNDLSLFNSINLWPRDLNRAISARFPISSPPRTF